MENSDYIGIFRLNKYPKLELEDSFVSTIEENFLQDFYTNLESKIKREYLKYLLHMTIAFCLLITLFYLGFYFYETIFPVSVTFSVFFVGVFIYTSKSCEIKARYFKFFRSYFPKSMSACCPTSYCFKIILKKKKFFIYLKKEF